MRELHFQDDQWEIHSLSGLTCSRLFGLSEFGDERKPQIVFLELSDGSWHRFYLSAFLGFWNQTSEEDLDTIINDDFEGYKSINYLSKFHLSNDILQTVLCEREATGTTITLRFQKGCLTLSESDNTDPHCISIIEFEPTESS